MDKTKSEAKMADCSKGAALEVKIKTLEQRVLKVEDSVEKRTFSLVEIDTKLQLLTMKLDTFMISLKEKSEEKKFNWQQMIAIAAIIVALAGTIWGTSFSVKKLIESQNPSEVSVKINDADLKRIADTIAEDVMSGVYKPEEER